MLNIFFVSFVGRINVKKIEGENYERIYKR